MVSGYELPVERISRLGRLLYDAAPVLAGLSGIVVIVVGVGVVVILYKACPDYCRKWLDKVLMKWI
jgi:hypothetical protein